MNVESVRPLVFVHIGESLPSYAIASYKRAALHWSGPVYALINRSAEPRPIDNLSFRYLEDFYDPATFSISPKGAAWRESVRADFLRKCLERFFVLEEFARNSDISSFFHAENDVLLFEAGWIGGRLDDHGAGIFVPRDALNRAIASLIYVNSLSSLTAFVEFMRKPNAFNNEMEGLAAFIDSEPDKAFSLPTIRNWEKPQPKWASIDPERLGAIFDAAGVGQWVSGIDARATPFPITNHFQNDRHSGDTFSSIHLTFIPRRNSLLVREKGRASPLPLANLHVHSKLPGIFRFTWYLGFLVAGSNLPLRIPLNFSPRKWLLTPYRLAKARRKRKSSARKAN